MKIYILTFLCLFSIYKTILSDSIQVEGELICCSSKLPTPQPTIFRPKRATTYPPSLSAPLKSPPYELGDEVDMKEKTGNNYKICKNG